MDVSVHTELRGQKKDMETRSESSHVLCLDVCTMDACGEEE